MVNKPIIREWFTADDAFKSIGVFPLTWADDNHAACPRCGAACTYWEGVIDQDRMGNDERGFSWDCYECKIHSECESL